MTSINTVNYNEDVDKLKRIIEIIDFKENALNKLIDKKNNLQELENSLRHVKKKNNAYDIKDFEKALKRNIYNYKNANILKKKIEILSKVLIDLNNSKKINLIKQLYIFFSFHGQTLSALEKDGILFHLLLEEKYLEKLIENRKTELQNENCEELQQEIKQLYNEQYIPLSQRILRQTIKENMNIEKLNNVITSIGNMDSKEQNEKNHTPILNKYKDDILDLYPVVLTTVDSIISNYKTYFKQGKKIDYIIIDEASQCDILSALPLLFIAKNIIIVGDCKQLSAIVNLNGNQLNHIAPQEYDYLKENFLTTISKTVNPPNKMLLEHYRCDYRIISYCNKYFYENKLKIYKDTKPGAISIIDSDQGKYVDKYLSSYKNEREIFSIDSQINNNIQNKFIITPFKRTI